MGTSKENTKESNKDVTPAKGKPKHTGKHQLADREEERRGQRDTSTNKSESNMQEESAPQVTPTQNDKTEHAAVKPPSSAAAAAPTKDQANTKSPSISKSSDNTRDRMEKNSPNRPKSRTKHNPKDHLPSEDTKVAAKPQHQEPPLSPKANTLLKHPQTDNTPLAEPPQKNPPTPQSSETITFKHMEGGTELWNHKYPRLSKHEKMYPMENSEAQFMSDSIVQVMATYKGLKRLDVPGCLEAASNTHNWFKLMSL